MLSPEDDYSELTHRKPALWLIKKNVVNKMELNMPDPKENLHQHLC